MFFNIMHGKYCKQLGFFILKNPTTLNGVTRMCSGNKKHLDNWEFTRHRKKPAGGGRVLTNTQELYKFNAWYFFWFN